MFHCRRGYQLQSKPPTPEWTPYRLGQIIQEPDVYGQEVALSAGRIQFIPRGATCVVSRQHSVEKVLLNEFPQRRLPYRIVYELTTTDQADVTLQQYGTRNVVALLTIEVVRIEPMGECPNHDLRGRPSVSC